MLFPEWFETKHINVKDEFGEWRGVKRCGMAKALDHLGMPLVGTHHRGIDDARNIARIVQQMLPDLADSAAEQRGAHRGGRSSLFRACGCAASGSSLR